MYTDTNIMPAKAISTRPVKKKTRAGWKQIQSKKKKSRTLKLALFVLAGVLGLLIFSWTIRFTQSLFSPWKLTENKVRNYLWNGEFNINILIRSDHISLLSYSPKQAKITLINIPDETFLEVPYGFGSWQIRAVYELGESQKNIGGDKLLKDTIQNFLALPIDGYLNLSSLEPKLPTAMLLDTLRKNPFSGLEFLSNLKTDLTLWELLRFKFAVLGVRFDKIKEIRLDRVLDKTSLADGTPVLTGDPVRVDSILSDLADPAIVAEHRSIAIFNGVNKPLLAQKAARLITNLGGNVIITANSDETIEKTRITGANSSTLKRLRQIFNLSDKINQNEASSSRAEINLELGMDERL